MNKYKVIKQALNKETLHLIKNTLKITKDVDYFLNNIENSNTTAFGDSQYKNSYSAYGHHVCEALMLQLHPLIESETGKKLLPTYSYARIYWHGSELAKHTDRPSCEYSISICIDYKDKPWDIYFDGECFTLKPGDLVIYKGCEVEHWRLPYDGVEQTQVFLHYVDAYGPYFEWVLDNRPILGLVKK
jgi:hypothetical protein